MPDGYVDLHHHLLHGMDDGPRTLEETAGMLRAAAAQGVAHIAVTPHIYPDQGLPDAQAYHRSLSLARACAQEAGLNVTLHPAAEIYYTRMVPMLLQQGRLPTLGDSWHVLVEFHPHDSFDTLCHAAMHIGNAGFSMVLAHAERYRCLRWGSRLASLRGEYRVQVQLNGSTLLSPGSFANRQWLHHVMRAGLVDIVASDAHDLSERPCTMAQSAALIASTWGEHTARRLLITNPMSILLEKQALHRVQAAYSFQSP